MLFFFCTFRSTFRREVPFRNLVYLSKYPVPCSSRTYGQDCLSPKSIEQWLLGFHSPSGAPSGGGSLWKLNVRMGTPFRNEIFLSKYLGPCRFKIYVVMGVFLQNSSCGCLLFPPPSGGRRPFDCPYDFPIYIILVPML